MPQDSSAARLIHTLRVAANLDSGWELFTQHRPDNPDTVITFYDEEGVVNPRQRRVQPFIQPNVKTIVRANGPEDSRKKARELFAWFCGLRNTVITDPQTSTVFVLNNAMPLNDIMRMGFEDQNRRRFLWSLSFRLSFRS